MEARDNNAAIGECGRDEPKRFSHFLLFITRILDYECDDIEPRSRAEQSTKETKEGQEIFFTAEWLAVARTYTMLPCNFNQISNNLLMEFFFFFLISFGSSRSCPLCYLWHLTYIASPWQRQSNVKSVAAVMAVQLISSSLTMASNLPISSRANCQANNLHCVCY